MSANGRFWSEIRWSVNNCAKVDRLNDHLQKLRTKNSVWSQFILNGTNEIKRGKLANLCLILLLLFAGSLQFRNFTFNYWKKAKKKSRKSSNIVQLADGVTALAQLNAVYSHRARSFNQWQRVLYPNFIIMKVRTFAKDKLLLNIFMHIFGHESVIIIPF